MCAGPPAPWLRSSPPSGFHGLYVRQLPAFAPAFPLRSADDARDRDIGVDGIMNHAPSAGLVWWQGRQVGQVMAAASPHATSCRARHGIKPHGPERLRVRS
jgi:hypothetical protein